MGDVLEDRGIWINETTWAFLCEKGKFRCEICSDHPDVEDADFFAEHNCCREHEAKWKRLREEE